MARNIAESFRQFRENLQISGLQAATLSTRQQNVRAALGKHLTIEEDFLTGSYRRNTLIAPLKEADIDIFAVLDFRYYRHYDGQNGGPAGLLDYVKKTLKETYPKTPDISRNGQAVTIQFSDFLVDVTPAFKRPGGGYLIPNSALGSWISTDPRKHVELMSAANTAHGSNLVPLVKMLKAWNRSTGRNLRSFHLEMLVMQILNGVRIADFSSGARYVFDKGRSLISQKNPDPAGYSDDLGDYINTQQKIQESTSRFQLAYERAVKAEAYAARGSISEAVAMWTLVFGSSFPSYG